MSYFLKSDGAVGSSASLYRANDYMSRGTVLAPVNPLGPSIVVMPGTNIEIGRVYTEPYTGQKTFRSNSGFGPGTPIR